MSDLARPVGVDLRSSDVQLAVTDAAGAVRLLRVPAAAALARDRVVYGDEAARLLAADPAAGCGRLLERVGDPVPCRLGAHSATAADLVARGIAAALPARPSALRVLAPDAWGPAHRAALASALVGAGLPSPRWIPELDAVAPPPSAGDGAPVLLLTTAPTVTHARVLSPSGAGWRSDAVAEVPFGADDVVEATFERAAARLTDVAGRPLTAEENRALADLCAPAAHRLPGSSRLDVSLPGLPGTRISREDVDRLLAPRVAAAFAALPAALGALGVGSVPARVLLEGVGSRVPVVAASIAEALGRPVVVAPADAAAVLASSAFAAPEEEAAAEVTAVLPAVAPAATAVAATVVLPAAVPVPAAVPAPAAVAVPPPADDPDLPMTYGWTSVPGRERGDRRGLKLAAAGGVLVLVLAGVGIAAGRTIQAALEGALQPAPPAAIPVGPSSPTATTPTLDFGSASPSETASPTPGTPGATPTTPTTQATSTTTQATTSTTKPPASSTSSTTKPPASTTTKTTTKPPTSTTKPPTSTTTTKPPTSTATPPPTTPVDPPPTTPVDPPPTTPAPPAGEVTPAG